MCRQLSVTGNVSLSQAQYFVSTVSNSPPTHSGPAQTLIEGNIVDGANSQYGPTDANSIGIKLASSVAADSVRVLNNQITSKQTGVVVSAVDAASHLDVQSNAFLSCVVNVSGLSQLNDFASGDATPACRPDFSVYRTANATPTTITDFDGVSVGAGDVGRAITVIVNDANTTLDFSGSSLKGNGGSDWVASSGDSVRAVWDGTNWLCVLSSALDGITALDNTGTPTVLGGSVFTTGGTATILDFDDGTVGQTITVLSEHDVTITDGTHIILHGSADLVMAASDSLTLVLKADNKWYETSRMVNAQTVFTGSDTWDPVSIAAYQTKTTNVTCTGAVEGMLVSCSHSDMTNAAEYSLYISGYVVAGGGSVQVTISNMKGGAVPVGEGTVKVRASAI
jgi:hypothetical protein